MKIKAIATAVVLVAASLVAVHTAANAADETLSVPKTTFPVCSALRADYCIESVTLSTAGGVPEQLVFQTNGTAAPVATPTATPDPSATATANPTPVPSVDPVPVVDPYAGLTDAGTAVAGIWTTPTWVEAGHSALGYNGLVIDAKAVNAFDNHLYLQVKPGKVTGANQTSLAKVAGTNTPASLSLDDLVTVKLRVKNFKAGVTVAFANSAQVDKQGDGAANTLTISAQAIPLPMAKAVADCNGEAGVSLYTSNGIGLFVAATNDPSSGFGVDGVSGDMVVTTNGMCFASTPTWDAETKSLNWVAAAPHFAEDGTTINQGAYKALIPVADAKLLWGLANPNDAVTALEVSMTTDTNGTAVNTVKSVAVKNGFIVVSSTGYQYSKPHFTMKLKAGTKTTGASKIKSITCVKGSKTKLVKGKSPKCPKGYAKKK